MRALMVRILRIPITSAVALSFAAIILSVAPSAGRTFKYSEDSDAAAYAPDSWDDVDSEDYDFDWERLDRVIDYDGNECDDGRQSPIDLRDDYAEMCDPIDEDDHRMVSYSNGNCTWADMRFLITPHELRMEFPMPDPRDPFNTGCRKPFLDLSGGFGTSFRAIMVSLKTPSEHLMNGRRYDAEIAIAHLGRGDSVDELMYNGILVDARTSYSDNPVLAPYLRGWEKIHRRTLQNCYDRFGYNPRRDLNDPPTLSPSSQPSVSSSPSSTPSSRPTNAPSISSEPSAPPSQSAAPSQSPTVNCERYDLSTGLTVIGRDKPGIMFDIGTFCKSDCKKIEVHGFDLNLKEPGKMKVIQIYSKRGTHVGFENNATVWRDLGVYSVLGKGKGAASRLNLSAGVPLTLRPGERQAFYIAHVDRRHLQNHRKIQMPKFDTVQNFDGKVMVYVGTAKNNATFFADGNEPGYGFSGAVLYGACRLVELNGWPTHAPTTPRPTMDPTVAPSLQPSQSPTTPAPSPSPTASPTPNPTVQPSISPTKPPSPAPTTSAPTLGPTSQPQSQGPTLNCVAHNLSTGFTENGRDKRGVMFDVESADPVGAPGRSISVRAFDLNLKEPGEKKTIQVYSKQGTHVGAEDDPTVWTNLGTYIVEGRGIGGARRLDLLEPVSVPAGGGERVAFYILHFDGRHVQTHRRMYTPTFDSVHVSDGTLMVYVGTAKRNDQTFAGGNQPGYGFSGDILYGACHSATAAPAEEPTPSPTAERTTEPTDSPTEAANEKCEAQVLSSGFANTGGENTEIQGIMFDVKSRTGRRPLTIEALDLNIEKRGNHSVQLYTKVGSHRGFEFDARAWTDLGQHNVVGMGQDSATRLALADGITLPRRGRQAFYVVQKNDDDIQTYDGRSATRAGMEHVADENLVLYFGTGKNRQRITSRSIVGLGFSGALHYRVCREASRRLDFQGKDMLTRYPYINIYRLHTSPWYFRYKGTLTMPPCTSVRHWRVLDIPMKISQSQLDLINEMIRDYRDPRTCQLATMGQVSRYDRVNVARPLQRTRSSHSVRHCDARAFGPRVNQIDFFETPRGNTGWENLPNDTQYNDEHYPF